MCVLGSVKGKVGAFDTRLYVLFPQLSDIHGDVKGIKQLF